MADMALQSRNIRVIGVHGVAEQPVIFSKSESINPGNLGARPHLDSNTISVFEVYSCSTPPATCRPDTLPDLTCSRTFHISP